MYLKRHFPDKSIGHIIRKLSENNNNKICFDRESNPSDVPTYLPFGYSVTKAG